MKSAGIRCGNFIYQEESNMMNDALYNAITDFSDKYGCHKFNDDENHQAYLKLVDMCVECGKIHPRNRNEFSTHGYLDAAIIYVSDRLEFCYSEN